MQLKLIPEGTARRKDVVKHLQELKKQIAINNKNEAAKNESKMVVVRKEYAYKLRETFLDAGLDIKVSTSGTSATQLNVKFALMNDVWVYKFIKENVMEIVKAMGFKKVYFDDGYDYNYSLTIK